MSIELVRLVEAHLISSDLEMFDDLRGAPMQCRSPSLLEDLGQVSYVFSDKTGCVWPEASPRSNPPASSASRFDPANPDSRPAHHTSAAHAFAHP